MTVREMNELSEVLDIMTPDPSAIAEVVRVHNELDPKNEPVILSMSLFGDSIWGTETIG